MPAAADDLARRVAAFLPVPLPPPPQKPHQLTGVAAAVLDAGGRLGRAFGDVFRRLRIDDAFYSGAPEQRRRNAGNGKNGGRTAARAPPAAGNKEGSTAGGGDPLGGPSGRFARSQGSMNLSATYDSRTNDVESSVVARGDLWRAEASRNSGGGGASGSAPGGAGDGANLFLVQLGPVLFVRDTTLLFPVHLSKRHLIWYGFERKVQWGALGVPSLLVSSQEMVLHVIMSMLCLNPFACSFMDMQFPNGQLRYVAGDGFTTRAFLPIGGGVLQAHGKFPGEKRISFSFKNRSGGSVVPTVQWPDKSLSLGLVQPLSWRRSGMMLQPATQISICPTIGGRHPGVCTELIHSANENVSVVCGYSHTSSPSAHASISIGRSKLNGGVARSGIVFRVDAPLHGFGRPWCSVQMNSGIEF
ncbi:unnamed protein product [Urochloa decumbens]|uniref:Uncharacterized protein n=1 Tax=Urochloa decumbens TaxID=240449 RepID=A0ABC9DWD3_9POAL